MADEHFQKFFTGAIAGRSIRSRRLVLGAWALIIVLAIGACVGVGANTDLESTGTGESSDANLLLEERFGTFESAPKEIVVFDHPSLTVDDEEYRADENNGLRLEFLDQGFHRLQHDF